MTSSDLFHATRQGRLQGVDHGSKQSESRDMGDSVYPGKNCVLEASLISLTVLSENKGAVSWALNFISANTAPDEVNGQHTGAFDPFCTVELIRHYFK